MSRLLALLCLFAGFASAAPRATDEILSRLQTCIENETSTAELEASLETLSAQELEEILKKYDKTWPKLRDRYFAMFEAEAKEHFSGSGKSERNRMVKSYRQDFLRVRDLPEVQMKKEIPKISQPAIDGLRKLLMPKPEELLEISKPEVKKMRKMVLTLGHFRDALVEAAVVPDDEQAKQGVLQKEQEIAAKFGDLDRDGLRIIKKNDEIATKAKIPEDERRGIRELNEWRILLGLNALVIDPKLSIASRGHSEDMAKLGFFAHESPVPGKKTPGDRAAKAGTRGGGENIYMGRESPHEANRGWFYSPGHHKNMFRAGYKTIGLGRYGRHWTQMFG